jgi:CRP-like cAMP-binding protein
LLNAQRKLYRDAEHIEKCKGEGMDLRKLFKTSEGIKEFQAGTTIFANGDPGDEMFVILDGEVEIHVGAGIVETLDAGEVIGEMALIDSKTRSATAIAKTDCRLAVINEKRFLFMVHETPYFALDIMKILADRLRHMNARSPE